MCYLILLFTILAHPHVCVIRIDHTWYENLQVVARTQNIIRKNIDYLSWYFSYVYMNIMFIIGIIITSFTGIIY